MSHFTVAVFTRPGQSIEELLAPYDENIIVPRYVRHTKAELIKQSRDEVKRYAESRPYLDYLKDPEGYLSNATSDHAKYISEEFPRRLQWTDEEHYEEAIKWLEPDQISPDGDELSTYNPKSKLDWYMVGGRWIGYLQLKPGTTGTLGNSSFYDLYRKLPDDRADSAKVSDVVFPDDFSTYAVVTPDGEWHEPGEMGWWGFSHATDEQRAEWVSNYKAKFIDSAESELSITIVDCHI